MQMELGSCIENKGTAATAAEGKCIEEKKTIQLTKDLVLYIHFTVNWTIVKNQKNSRSDQRQFNLFYIQNVH